MVAVLSVAPRLGTGLTCRGVAVECVATSGNNSRFLCNVRSTRIRGKTSKRTNAPWVAILVCAAHWALCLGLGFSRLITLDIMLYGTSLSLEFVTLVVLRIREPNLKREFKVPGGMVGVILNGVFPIALLSMAVVKSDSESILGVNGLLFGLVIILAGFVVYGLTRRFRGNAKTTELADVEVTETA